MKNISAEKNISIELFVVIPVVKLKIFTFSFEKNN